MWREGDIYRKKHNTTGLKTHTVGIYSEKGNSGDMPNIDISPTRHDNVSRISHKVDTMRLNDKDDDNGNNSSPEVRNTSMTQGDKLNKIKALRRHGRPVLVGTSV